MPELNEKLQSGSRAEMLRVLKSRPELGVEKMGLVPDGKDMLSNRLGVGAPSPIGRRRNLGVHHSLQTAKPLPNARNVNCTQNDIDTAQPGAPCARFRKKNFSDTNLLALVYV